MRRGVGVRAIEPGRLRVPGASRLALSANLPRDAVRPAIAHPVE
jgi:hypothetical protein